MDLLKFSVKDFVMHVPFRKWVPNPREETDGRVKQYPEIRTVRKLPIPVVAKRFLSFTMATLTFPNRLVLWG